MRTRLWLLAAVFLGSCSHVQTRDTEDRTVCAESRGMFCVAERQCSMDRARGCRVCQCVQAGATENESRLGSGVPPDQRPVNPNGP